MDPRTFRFVSGFTLEAPRAELYAVLVDLEHYGDWWPQVRAVAKGWARFRLEQQPGRTHVRFEQRVRAEAPLFAVASYLARPVLTWNHHRMMAGAERGLRARFERGQPSAATAAS